MNLAYLTRGDFTGDVFASITARGPNRNVVRNEITVDLPQCQGMSRSKTVFLEPGKTYGIDYLYDWTAGTFTLTISDDLGPIKFISGPATGPVWTKNKAWTILFSEPPREGHAPTPGLELQRPGHRVEALTGAAREHQKKSLLMPVWPAIGSCIYAPEALDCARFELRPL